ncbi:MAG: glycosyltransferase family 2 protein [Pirellulaceae bacterium]
MNGFEVAIALLLAFVTLEQAIAVAIFLAYCRRPPRLRSEDDLPNTLVVLALRGCDPSLRDCLRALFSQDYPRYTVRVVVDNRADPAWGMVERAIQERNATHVSVRALKDPSDQCTLKCSALYQATADLEGAVDVVAFLDADVIPHRTWLRELVNPLDDASVGAAMGNRWYAPRDGHWGSLVRFVWNVGAVINMYYWNIPWGGTLAVRADILRNTDLRAQWSKAGCDDVPLYRVLLKLRLKLVFVPDLLLVNRDEINVTRCLKFVWRQMLWVRLYHPVCWWICAVFHYLTIAAQWAALVLAPLAVWTERWVAAGVLAGLFLANYLVTFALVVCVERQARRVLASRGGGNTVRWTKILAALQLTQVVTAVAFLYAWFARVVEWRGIRYRVRGPWSIQMVEYHPSTATTAGTRSGAHLAEVITASESNPTESGEG